MRAFVDAIAEIIVAIGLTSPSQWLLRGLAAVAVAVALLLAFPDGPFYGIVAGTVSVLVIIVTLVMTVEPDSDMGTAVPIAIILGSALGREPAWGPMVATGLALLVAHLSWAYAATMPAHGRLAPGAARLMARGALLSLLVAAAAIGLVWLLSLVQVGTWAVLLGAVALVALFVLIVPLDRTGFRR